MPRVHQTQPSSSRTSELEPVYVGVDPGKKGAFAALFSSEDLAIWRMPESYETIPVILRRIRERSNGRPIRITMEKVNGYIGGRFNPGAAMFVFGQGYGHLQMAISIARKEWQAEGISSTYVEIHPSKWPAFYNLEKRKVTRLVKDRKTRQMKQITGKESDTVWKNRLLKVACSLYPGYHILLAHGDAVLLAHYGKCTHRPSEGE